ncbi:MAG: hypothetical protein E7089_06725 [Bacteroidales bacterium]|nr:hypothetical protein [Bacteroidales bacterium]
MAKICFPHYEKGEFVSLAEALKFLKRKDYSLSSDTLWKIVQYNTRYRNYLRRYGVNILIIRFIIEAPQLIKETSLLNHLRKWAAKEKLADYDIQCYNIKDKVTILGHTFNGLKDIREHVELCGREGYDGLHCWSPTEVEPYEDVHVGHFYDNYPVFDSYDLGDDRTYQNYIFRNSPIAEANMKETFCTFHGFNFCMVHENIPEDRLPILYYSGDGKYMLLATKRE